MIPARGPQTKFLYDLCCAIFGVPHMYEPLGRRLAGWGAGDMSRASHRDGWVVRGKSRQVGDDDRKSWNTGCWQLGWASLGKSGK